MRFLSSMPSGDDEREAVRQADALKHLHDELLGAMTPAKRVHYGEMLTFHATSPLSQPLAGGTLFGLLLSELEFLFDGMARMQEAQWREASDYPETQTTPFQQRCEFGHVAMLKLGNHVDLICQDVHRIGAAPESMLAVVSANISVNRVLLEMAAQDARGLEAERLCLPFFQALNDKGLEEVPAEVDAASDRDVDEVIRQLFRRWFAFEGEFLQKGSLMSRHMTSTDIDKIVRWARELQAGYSAHQSASTNDRRSGQVHENSCSLFCFALVLAAAFFTGVPTEHVFKPSSRKNALHSLFPGRDAIARGDQLTVHQTTAFWKAYGLLFFGNREWDLRADGIREYSLGAQVRRAQLQLAMNAAVKAKGSRELLALTRHLKHLNAVREMEKQGGLLESA